MDFVNESPWDTWEALRSGSDPDPIEVLRTVAPLQEYFSSIEREAIRVARAQGRTWDEIGSALGKTRQAIWQRVGTRAPDAGRAFKERWALNAEVNLKLRANPLPKGWAQQVPKKPSG
jgi:hypothetical protein